MPTYFVWQIQYSQNSDRFLTILFARRNAMEWMPQDTRARPSDSKITFALNVSAPLTHMYATSLLRALPLSTSFPFTPLSLRLSLTLISPPPVPSSCPTLSYFPHFLISVAVNLSTLSLRVPALPVNPVYSWFCGGHHVLQRMAEEEENTAVKKQKIQKYPKHSRNIKFEFWNWVICAVKLQVQCVSKYDMLLMYHLTKLCRIRFLVTPNAAASSCSIFCLQCLNKKIIQGPGDVIPLKN